MFAAAAAGAARGRQTSTLVLQTKIAVNNVIFLYQINGHFPDTQLGAPVRSKSSTVANLTHKIVESSSNLPDIYSPYEKMLILKTTHQNDEHFRAPPRPFRDQILARS